MRVYIFEVQDKENSHVIGVFSTEDKAESARMDFLNQYPLYERENTEITDHTVEWAKLGLSPVKFDNSHWHLLVAFLLK